MEISIADPPTAGPRTHVTAGDKPITGRFDTGDLFGACFECHPPLVPLSDKSRLAVLLEHFSTIDDPRDVRRITHPLAEILLLVVYGRCTPLRA